MDNVVPIEKPKYKKFWDSKEAYDAYQEAEAQLASKREDQFPNITIRGTFKFLWYLITGK